MREAQDFPHKQRLRVELALPRGSYLGTNFRAGAAPTRHQVDWLERVGKPRNQRPVSVLRHAEPVSLNELRAQLRTYVFA